MCHGTVLVTPTPPSQHQRYCALSWTSSFDTSPAWRTIHLRSPIIAQLLGCNSCRASYSQRSCHSQWQATSPSSTGFSEILLVPTASMTRCSNVQTARIFLAVMASRKVSDSTFWTGSVSLALATACESVEYPPSFAKRALLFLRVCSDTYWTAEFDLQISIWLWNAFVRLWYQSAASAVDRTSWYCRNIIAFLVLVP